MKTMYKIIIIAVCSYFGVFLGPVVASNVYCDFVSQEMCTSRITGVVLPPLNLIIPSLPSDDCIVNNDGVMKPCYNDAGLLEWPFPPRMEIHPERECGEMCTDVEKLQDVPKIKMTADDTSSGEPYKTDFMRDYEHHGSQMSRENLCIENKGYWDLESRHCYFQTREDMKQSDRVIDESLKRQVTGETAKTVCKIMEMQCPDSPVFNGQLQPDMSIYFIYIQGEGSYTFKINEDQIRYMFVDPDWRPSEGTEPPIGWITYDENAVATG